MAICPNCLTTSEALLDPCPSGDGFYCIDESDLAANKGDELLGTAIGGRFVVVAMLGTGSMARVYRAHQLEVDRTVALKVFRVDDLYGSDQSDEAEALAQSRERFAQEARVLGKLAHPNCVTLFDFGAEQDGRVLYIAMEHVAGVSLRRAMNRGLKLDAIYEILQQILFALREAHALDIVHRDLKPENIILSFRYSNDEPVVKVVDFGIAKLLGHDRRIDHTRVGALFGTPAYMSPEQCRGEVDSVGPHSDIYSLGCILFEMVTGRLPYESVVPMEMLTMHSEAPIPEVVPRVGLEIPHGLAEFITICLQKSPADRFADAQSMLTALGRLREGDTAGAAQRGARGSVRRVVVPRNQISGIDIQPPSAPAAAAAAPAPNVEPRVQTREQVPTGRGVHDTSRGSDVTGGFKQHDGGDASGQAAGRAMIILAIGFLTVACVVLFYFLWETMSRG